MQSLMSRALGTIIALVSIVLWLCVSNGGAQCGTEPYSQSPDIEQELICCINVEVLTLEQAETLRSLGIRSRGTGSMVRPFSEALWAKLERGGHEPRMTCFRRAEHAQLETGTEYIYLSEKTETTAGRPMVAKLRQTAPAQVSERKVLFLGGELAVNRARSYSDELKVSKNAHFVSSLAPRAVGDTSSWGKWEVFDCFGNKSGELPVHLVYDESPNEIVLSDLGNWIEIVEYGRQVGFYDTTGRLLRRVVISDIGPASCSADFSADGRYVALAFRFRYYSKRPTGLAEQTCVTLHSSDGTRIWKFTPPPQLPRIGKPWVSQDGTYVVVSIRDRKDGLDSRKLTFILDSDGTVVAKMDDFSATKVKFSSSLEYVMLRNPSELRVVRTRTGEVIFRHRIHTSIMSFDLAEKARLVGFTTGRSVVLLDFEGRQLWRINARGDDWAPRPSISLSDDGNEMSLGLGSRFFVYRSAQGMQSK